MTELPPGREMRIANARDVIMKITAAAVVALDKMVPAPRAPNTV